MINNEQVFLAGRINIKWNAKDEGTKKISSVTQTKISYDEAVVYKSLYRSLSFCNCLHSSCCI